MATVSVIIPTCNRAAYLRTALDSVLSQTFTDFEVIVVDDASTDDTSRVVKEFKAVSIQYVRHDENRGGSVARNTGIAKSQSEYIAFLDDDDEWEPTKLELQMDLLKRSAPNVGLVYTGCRAIDRATGKVLGQRTPAQRGDLSTDMLRENCIGSTSSTVLKRVCFEEVGVFDHTLPSFQDYDLWIRLAAKFHIECVSLPLLKYYTHEHKIWTNPQAIMKGIALMLEKHKTFPSELPKYFSHHMLAVGEMYCRKGDFKQGRLAYREAIRLYPYALRYYLDFALSLVGHGTWTKVKELKQKFTGSVGH